MKTLFTVRRKTLAEWLTVTLACLLFASVAAHQQWLWRFDTVLYDTALGWRAIEPEPDIVIVAIDDRSLADIGRWPWSRAVHAALLDRLGALGVKAVAFDIILHELAYEQPAADHALAVSIAAHGQVVLPVTHGTRASASDGEALPAPPFRDAAAALGHIHIELDPDGIARTLYLWEGMAEPRHPQLALATLALVDPARAAAYPPPSADAPTVIATPRVSRAEQGGWRRAGWMHIPFAGPPGTFRYVSYVDVLRGEVPAAVLRDAIAFVGASAVGMGDMVPTPTSGHASLMPGVEVHATVFDALRRGIAIRSLPAWTVALLNAMVVAGLMVVMLRARPRAALLATFGTVALTLSATWLALIVGLLWVPPAAAMAACMLAYPLWSWRRLEASRHYFEVELEALRVPGQPDAETRVADPFVDRIEIVQEAALRQRELQRSRDETMDFLSHDLRAPLAAIVTTLEAEHARAGGDAKRDALFERVDRYARSALGMAENLVRLVRAESMDPARFTELSLDMIVQDAADEAWALAQARALRLDTLLDLPDDADCVVRGDADLLRRAILNLLSNAIKYSPERETVTLALAPDDGGWKVAVRDHGPGISAEQQAQLFQRFSRLDGEHNRKLGGIGLGLLMVRTVAERHGGRVGVVSQPGAGSTFFLWLPAA